MINDLFWFSAVVAVAGPAALLAVSLACPADPSGGTPCRVSSRARLLRAPGHARGPGHVRG